MSLESFQLIDNEPIDNSIIRKDFFKLYHHKEANLNDPDQKIEFIFGENNNYHQIRNAYLEFDITVRNPAANFAGISVKRLINNAFACCCRETRLATTGGADLEHNKYVSNDSNIMRVVISKDSDLSSYFDKLAEIAFRDDGNNILKQLLIINHEDGANKGKIKGQLTVEHVFGFCKTFNKMTKNLGFQLTLKTTALQDNILTTIATDMNITINSL